MGKMTLKYMGCIVLRVLIGRSRNFTPPNPFPFRAPSSRKPGNHMQTTITRQGRRNGLWQTKGLHNPVHKPCAFQSRLGRGKKPRREINWPRGRRSYANAGQTKTKRHKSRRGYWTKPSAEMGEELGVRTLRGDKTSAILATRLKATERESRRHQTSF